MNFPSEYLNKIICSDSLQMLKTFPNESVDLVVTSPPYNLNIRKTFKTSEKWKGKWNNSKLQKIGYDQYDDHMPEADYIAWQQNILQECFRIIKPTGAIFYNHKWRVQNSLYQQRLEIIEKLPLRQIIIWKKPGGINFNEKYFLPTYEIIYLLAKPEFKIANKAYCYGDVWSITPEKNSWHPAPFPLELAKRCIESCSGEIILDPFMGSGTVCLAAQQAGKQYIGIDLSQEYCNKAQERLLSESAEK